MSEPSNLKQALLQAPEARSMTGSKVTPEIKTKLLPDALSVKEKRPSLRL
jgi:hypothetical protein